MIGIDPGVSGAIARPPFYISDMPTLMYSPKGYVKRAVDLTELASLLGYLGEPVAIERVASRPGQGGASMFSLGMSFYGACGVAHGLNLPVRLVDPKAWKRHFSLGSDKNASLALARKLYPEAELHLAKHHNRAEALLIATYAMEVPE